MKLEASKPTSSELNWDHEKRGAVGLSMLYSTLRMRVAVCSATFLIHPVQTGESQAYLILWSRCVCGSMTNVRYAKKEKSFKGLA